mmetsp:Transcript_12598/g.21900  ORF Transcript_12598/g.21900 Transcript_12598/m.21900 type:complete len:163 (+) Transcript_12598:52-540(+)
MMEATGATEALFAAALGAGRFLPVAVALRGCAASHSWRDGIHEALQEAEDIDLHRFNVNDQDVCALVKRCPHAQRINLYSCRQVTNCAVQALAHECSQLTDLNLTGNPHVTPVGVDEVVSCCKQLESLSVAGCDRIPENIISGRYARFCDIFDEEEEGPWTA